MKESGDQIIPPLFQHRAIEEPGCPRGTHNPEIVGSNPTRATILEDLAACGRMIRSLREGVRDPRSWGRRAKVSGPIFFKHLKVKKKIYFPEQFEDRYWIEEISDREWKFIKVALVVSAGMAATLAYWATWAIGKILISYVEN